MFLKVEDNHSKKKYTGRQTESDPFCLMLYKKKVSITMKSD